VFVRTYNSHMDSNSRREFFAHGYASGLIRRAGDDRRFLLPGHGSK
jgi:hypothetical protein